MELIPVNSSTVAAIGWQDGVIRVAFKDGKVYEAPGNERTFEEFLAAESKGAFARTLPLKRAGFDYAVGGDLPANVPYVVGENQEPVQAHDVDKCCGAALDRALRSNAPPLASWECPKCGARWTPSMIGTVKWWSPTPDFEILKLRG